MSGTGDSLVLLGLRESDGGGDHPGVGQHGHGVLGQRGGAGQLLQGIEPVLQQLEVVELLLADDGELEVGEAGGGGGGEIVELLQGGEAGEEGGDGGGDLQVGDGGGGVLGVEVGERGQVVRREDVVERNLLTGRAPNLLVLQALELILNIYPVIVGGDDLNILRVSSLQLSVHVDKLVVSVGLLVGVLPWYSFRVEMFQCLSLLRLN